MVTKQKTYWFGIRDDSCPFDGEEFFVESESADKARETARNLFSGFHVTFFGRVSEYFAERMGLDTY